MDDEQKLNGIYEQNRTKYRDASSAYSTPSKQVRFAEQGFSPTAPSFGDPFSGNANSVRHPPRYAKRDRSPNGPPELPKKDEVKMRPLPLPFKTATNFSPAKPPDRALDLWEKTIDSAIDSAEGVIDLR